MTKNIQQTIPNTKQINQTIFNDIDSKDSLIREISSRSGFTLSDTKIIIDTFIDIFEECMLYRISMNIYGLFSLSHTLVGEHMGNRPYKGRKGYKEPTLIKESTRSNLKIGLNMRRLSKSELSTISEEE